MKRASDGFTEGRVPGQREEKKKPATTTTTEIEQTLPSLPVLSLGAAEEDDGEEKESSEKTVAPNGTQSGAPSQEESDTQSLTGHRHCVAEEEVEHLEADDSGVAFVCVEMQCDGMSFVPREGEEDEEGIEADEEADEGDRRNSDAVVLPQAEQATDADTDRGQEQEEAEVYEPRAAYDYVDEDEEDDEFDTLASSPLERGASPGEWRRTGRSSRKEEEAEVEWGWERYEGRLTPCDEFDEEEEDEDEEGRNLERMRWLSAHVQEHQQQSRRSTESTTDVRPTEVANVSAVQSEEEPLLLQEDMVMGEQEQQEDRAGATPPMLEAIQEEAEEAELGAETEAMPPEGGAEAKEKEVRIMSPEEEARWEAYFERRRETCLRVSTCLTHFCPYPFTLCALLLALFAFLLQLLRVLSFHHDAQC